MTQRFCQNRNYAATGLMISALLVMIISSIPIMAVAGFGAMRSQGLDQTSMTIPASLVSGATDQELAVDSPDTDMGQFCPMMFGCMLMSSGSHCGPALLVSVLPICDGNATMTAALGPTDAPMHPATIGFFHFRPPIL